MKDKQNPYKKGESTYENGVKFAYGSRIRFIYEE